MGETDTDIADHLAWCRDLRGYTEATIRARTWVLNRFSLCIDRPAREAQTGHLLMWEQTVVAGLAAQSRRAYIGHVRGFYRWALRTGIVTSDPSEMLTQPKVPKPLPRPIDEDDLARALAAAPPKTAAMIALMAYAGLRCIEVAGLAWSDITVSDGHTWVTVRNGKGGKDRVVPIGLVVQRALRRHGTKRRGAVFLGRDGRQIEANSVSKAVNYFLRQQGIGATAHKLRARFATQAASVVDMPLVAQLCGWESLDTARHYVKPNVERSAVLVAALDALADPLTERAAS